jgi:hypothetical protein
MPVWLKCGYPGREYRDDFPMENMKKQASL